MMSDPYAPPSAAIAEAPRAVVATRWRWLAYFAAVLCLLPIIVCVQNAVQASIFLRMALVVFAMPWAATALLLVLLRKTALLPMLFAFATTALLSTFSEDVEGFAVIFGYALTMLIIVLWLRKRRALL